MTADTAKKVAAGLSGVVASVDLDASRRRRQRRRLAQAAGLNAAAPAEADPRYVQIMQVVDGLAVSLGNAMTVPGEEAITIVSAALQARAAAAAADAG